MKYIMSLLPYIFTEMGDRVNEYKIRLNNKIPHGDHTLARVPKEITVHVERTKTSQGMKWRFNERIRRMMIAISFNLAKLRDFTARQLFNQDCGVLFYSIS